MQALQEGIKALALKQTRVGAEISDGRQLSRLLRPRRQRPRRRRAAEHAEKFAPSKPIESHRCPQPE
jgi:hypothetical protein